MRSTPDMLERAKELRQRSSSLHGKALEGVRLEGKVRQRGAQSLSAASAVQEKSQSQALNSNIAKFLKTDLSVGLTFARIALQSYSDRDKRARNQENARKAHDAIVRWKNRAEIGQSEALEIDANLQKLRSALEELGERF